MIYEIALLPVKSDQLDSFRRAFGEVAGLQAYLADEPRVHHVRKAISPEGMDMLS